VHWRKGRVKLHKGPIQIDERCGQWQLKDGRYVEGWRLKKVTRKLRDNCRSSDKGGLIQACTGTVSCLKIYKSHATLLLANTTLTQSVSKASAVGTYITHHTSHSVKVKHL